VGGHGGPAETALTAGGYRGSGYRKEQEDKKEPRKTGALFNYPEGCF